MTVSEQLTPPLNQQQSTDNKLGLMLGKGKDGSAVAQILTWIHFFSYKLFGSPSRGVTVQKKKNSKRKIQFQQLQAFRLLTVAGRSDNLCQRLLNLISSWNNFTCQTYNVDNVVVPFFKRFLGLTKVVHLDLILINNIGLVQAIERALNFVHSTYFSWQFIDEQHSLTD